MALPLYLAQTPIEMAGNPLPGGLAYMACHFSPGGMGLSNLPKKLPSGAILILDDSTPMDGHDPEQILKELSVENWASILLDFQRPGIPGQREFAQQIAMALPCPVGVSELYARELSCPVFLPPVPPDKPLAEYLVPWQSREIWLEAALDGITLTLTEDGCSAAALLDFPGDGLAEERLHCHYSVKTGDHSIVFHLWRTRDDLTNLLAEAEALGVTKAIGLWKELHG